MHIRSAEIGDDGVLLGLERHGSVGTLILHVGDDEQAYLHGDWRMSVVGTKSAPAITLDAAERTFVAEWPTGREGQPELVDLAWADQDEVFPFASVEHWLRTLPTVRVYRGTRGRVCPVDAPVLSGQRVSDGRDIDLDGEELRRGTWVGERTLRLPDGWQVVFNSPFR